FPYRSQSPTRYLPYLKNVPSASLFFYKRFYIPGSPEHHILLNARSKISGCPACYFSWSHSCSWFIIISSVPILTTSYFCFPQPTPQRSDILLPAKEIPRWIP